MDFSSVGFGGRVFPTKQIMVYGILLGRERKWRSRLTAIATDPRTIEYLRSLYPTHPALRSLSLRSVEGVVFEAGQVSGKPSRTPSL